MEKFNPERFADVKKEDDKFTFFFVGRIVGDKGINELVEAFTKLHEIHRHTRLVLVGNYEANLDPVKQVTMDRIMSNPDIVACGPRYGEDLLAEYMKSDCHVLPSYREGFPNTPMEAGAMGLPNIVTDINGAREIIVNGENGLIVPSKDADALYEAMEKMLTDEPMRKSMAGKARKMIADRFEKNFVQKSQIEFYEELL